MVKIRAPRFNGSDELILRYIDDSFLEDFIDTLINEKVRVLVHSDYFPNPFMDQPKGCFQNVTKINVLLHEISQYFYELLAKEELKNVKYATSVAILDDVPKYGSLASPRMIANFFASKYVENVDFEKLSLISIDEKYSYISMLLHLLDCKRYFDDNPLLPTMTQKFNTEENEILYAKIKEEIKNIEYCSISILQRNFSIGFNRAGRMFNRLVEDGLVSEEPTKNGCKVLIYEGEGK